MNQLDMILSVLVIGSAKQNEPIYAGTIVFGVVGLFMFYLSFLSQEMEGGRVMKALSIALLLFAILATFWPMRPWPH